MKKQMSTFELKQFAKNCGCFNCKGSMVNLNRCIADYWKIIKNESAFYINKNLKHHYAEYLFYLDWLRRRVTSNKHARF